MNLKHYAITAMLAATTVVAAQNRSRFTPAEQQQISIETPGLFDRSAAFNVDFSSVGQKEYSFPLPVGKATQGNDNSVRIETKQGDAVKAMFDGTVRLSRDYPEMGSTIVIRHRNGLETVYSNNAQNLVKVGDAVKAGQTIAIVGKKNNRHTCTFAIMVNGCKINPSTIVNLRSHKLRRQMLLCELSGAYVNVSIVGGKNNKADMAEVVTDKEMDKFENTKTFNLDLTQIEKEHWAYPLPGSKVISPYGGRRRHSGVDIKTVPNDNVLAAFDGVVTRSSPYFGYGNCIVIKHNYGLETLYSHQSKNFVKVGDKVKAGQVIGLTGRTGRATTAHLHFETHFNGRRFDPALLFDHTNKSLQQATLTMGKGGRVTSKKHLYAKGKSQDSNTL